MDEFKRVRRILRDVEREERKEARRQKRRCDWEDPEDVRVYRESARLRARMEILDELVPTRVCPDCLNLRIGSRQWVISKDQKEATCRSCFFTQHGSSKMIVTLDVELFSAEPRFRMEGGKLTTAISRTGMSAREFARRAGWSASYQRKLMTPGERVINQDTCEVILEVLKAAGVVTRDLLRG